MKVNYSDISKTYDKHRSYSENEIKEIIRFAGIKEGMRVLDIGCGTGNVSSQLLGHINMDAVGIDISLPMLEVAKGKSLEVIVADAGHHYLPFQDNTFDTVILAYVIHQISSLLPLFAECNRVLRNGTLVILTSSHRQIEHQHPVIKEFFPSLIDTDKARFTDIPEVDALLDQAGFTDIEHAEMRIEKIPLDDAYLQKVKGKYVSTYHLLPQSEFENGVARLEKFIKNSRQPEFREWRCTLIRAEKNNAIKDKRR